ncbi:MAG: N-acetylmuramoyl-L-alanine amidase [Clostridia bacterium]|nr:N-acetylmuramoyl-L-alanine amidase [Clostridia bacterium]
MNKKICIIVGHGKSANGGYDSGAVSPDGRYQEFRIAKEISKYAADYLGCDLMNYGGNLYLTERIAAVNKADYDFIAEIHLNAGGGTGTECFYYNGSPTGLKVSKSVTEEISKEFSVRNRGAKVRLNKSGKDYFAIIRDTRPTAILIETVFIDNADDVKLVSTKQGQKRCGEAIGRAIEKTLGTNEKFKVRINADSLYIRSGAGPDYQAVGVVKKGEIHEIIQTDSSGKWGKLADRRGWISLNSKYIGRI